MRAIVPDTTEMAGVVESGLCRAQTHINSDAGGAQARMALPCNLWIGVLDRRHHPLDAGGDHRVHTRRRLAEMRARLERDIERGTPCRLACPPQRFGLGMRTSAGLRPAPPDDHPVLDDDGADGRVRPGAPLPAPTECQCKVHETAIGVLGLAGFCAN